MKRLLMVAVLVCSAAAGGAHTAQTVLVQQAGSSASTADKSAQVDALVSSLIKDDAPGAAVMVIEGGRVVHDRGYGLARLDTGERVTHDTAFDTGSVSKQFTAMAVMMLVERGKLSYEDTLNKFFPDFPAYAKTVTVHHLLNHTSGMVDVINPQWFRKGYEPTSGDLVRMMAGQASVRFAPGEKFEYNNAGYVLLAVIVEKTAGKPFASFMKENIFQPLSMSKTVVYDETKPLIRNMAVSYFFEANLFKPYAPTSDSLFYGAKGVVSTTEDLYKWDQALSTEKLVKASTLKQAFTPARLRDGTETLYGFGWFVGKENGTDVFEHAGGYLGYRATIRRYPARRTTVIVLSNNALVESTSIARKIAGLYLSGNVNAPVAVKVETATMQEYAGKYEGDPSVMPNFIIEITVEEGELYITSPIKPKTKLLALSTTEFQIAETASSVLFKRDEKGLVAGLTLKTRRAVINARKLPTRP